MPSMNISIFCIVVVFFLTLTLLLPDKCYSLKAEWIRLNPGQTISPRRSGHASFGGNTFVDDHHFTNCYYVFGGYVEEDDPASPPTQMKRYVTNDLWRWNNKAKPSNNNDHEDEVPSWTRIETTGDLPRVRLATASALTTGTRTGTLLSGYLFGGWDPGYKGDGGEILDTVHRVDLSATSTPPTWHEIGTLPNGPTSRHVAVTFRETTAGDSSTAATATMEKILIHDFRCDGYVWIFNPIDETFTKQATTGSCPSSRGLHAACCCSSNIVLFGGAAKDQTMSNEIFVLSTETWEWKAYNNNNMDVVKCPSPRAGPSMCPYNDDCVLLFGGAEATPTGLNPRGDVWAFHLSEGRWECLIDDNDDGVQTQEKDGLLQPKRPPPRNAATLAFIGTTTDPKTGIVENEFLLSGGWHPFVRTFEDNYVLRVSADET